MMSSEKYPASVGTRRKKVDRHHHDSITEDEEAENDVFYENNDANDDQDRMLLKPPPVTGETKLGKITLKVMTQIANDKNKNEIMVERVKNVPTVTDESPLATPKSLDRNFARFQDRRFSNPTNFRRSSGAPVFASLVRVMKFRRKSGASVLPKGTLKRRTSSVSSTMTVLPEDEMTDLPQTPRFCATLSPEAQYAMLRGYEDVIVDSLTQEHPEYRSMLSRPSTPKTAVIKSPRPEIGPISSRSSTEYINLSYKEQNMAKVTQTRQTSQTNSTTSRLKSHVLPEISRDKQLLLSSRFQRAMDILDSMKQSRDMMITSARPGVKRINPLHHYNSWSQSWTKEFQLETIDARTKSIGS